MCDGVASSLLRIAMEITHLPRRYLSGYPPHLFFFLRLSVTLFSFWWFDELYDLVSLYVLHSISFQTFFRIVVHSWKFSMFFLYRLWDDWQIFMISGSNEQLQQELEYTLLKLDCHSWWISKMQSGREDNLEERYAIKFCFKLGKNATECFRQFWSILHESSITFWVA